MDVQPAVQGVSGPAPGAESGSDPVVLTEREIEQWGGRYAGRVRLERPAGLTDREIWQWANRQAARERAAGGHDWRWWDWRRRELAGWPEEARLQWANRAAFVDVLATGARPLMQAWRARRNELLEGGGGIGSVTEAGRLGGGAA